MRKSSGIFLGFALLTGLAIWMGVRVRKHYEGSLSPNNGSATELKHPAASSTDAESGPSALSLSPRLDSSKEPDSAVLKRMGVDGLEIQLLNSEGSEIAGDLAAISLNERAEEYFLRAHLMEEVSSELDYLAITKTEGEGRFRLSPNADCMLGIIATSPECRPSYLVIDPKTVAESEIITIRMESANSFCVRALHADGTALNGARVLVRSSDLGISRNASAGEKFQSRAYSREHITGPDGTAYFSDAPVGLVSIYVEPQHGMASSAAWEIATTEDYTIICYPSFSIAGRIQSPSGASISNVALSVLRIDGAYAEEPIISTTSDIEGNYSFEEVPASGEMFLIMLHDPRYEATRSGAIVGVPGSMVEIDLFPREAVGFRATVQTGRQQPVVDALCQIKQVAGGRVPQTVTTGHSGELFLEGYVVPGEFYYLLVEIGGYWTESEVFTVSQPRQDAIEIRVKNVTTVTGLTVLSDGREEEIEECIFYPQEDKIGYCAMFSGRDFPVLLPAGIGELEVQYRTGETNTYCVVLPPGEELELLLESTMAELAFDLNPEECHRVEVYDQHNTIRYSQDVTGARISCVLTPGAYYLALLQENSSVDVGPIWLPPEGLSLGTLDGGAQAKVKGVVSNSKGLPVMGIPVRAFGALGYRSRASYTDEAGQFRIEGLPPGEYEIECASNGMPGGNLPSVSVRMFLGAGADIHGVSLEVASSVTQIRFGVGEERRLDGAFVLSDTTKQEQRGDHSREMFASTLHTAGYCGYWILDGGNIELQIDAIASNATQHDVRPEPCSSFDLQFDQRVTGRATQLRVAGRVLGIAVRPNMERELRIVTDCPFLVEIGRIDSSGSWTWSELGAERSISEGECTMQVVDTAGLGISGAVIAGRERGNRSISNAKGAARLGIEDGEWVWVDHSQYWAEQKYIRGETATFTLRRSAEARTIAAEMLPRAESVQIVPLFELGYPFCPLQSLTREGPDWNLPFLPEGEYELQVTEEGGVERAVHLTLPFQGHARVRY